MTDAFRSRFVVLAAAVEGRSRWRVLDEVALTAARDRFLGRGGARQAELIVLVTNEEFAVRPAYLVGFKYSRPF